jgi:hypothetical protein
VDAELLAQWDGLMRAVDRPYALAITHEKNRYIQEAATTFPSMSRLVDSLFDHHAASMAALAEKYQGHAIRLALLKTLKAEKSALRDLQMKDGIDPLWLYLVRKWMSEFGMQRAKETAQTTREDLQRIIDAALAPDVEFNPQQVATDLLKAQALSAYRAETIAQTEVHNAMMYASEEGAQKVAFDNGVEMLKRWVPVLDERTRVNHASMASVAPIPLQADFTVGGEKMSRPGDPRGSSGNVIRCRCVLAFQTTD